MRAILIIMLSAAVVSGCTKLFIYKSKGKLILLGDKSEVRKGKKLID